MRFVFKTSYDADIKWFKHGAQLFWYMLLLVALVALPLVFVWTGNPYLLGEITAVLIFSISCLGLMLLTGQTGLASLGHAAFMAMGCYANILLLQAGLPWLIATIIDDEARAIKAATESIIASTCILFAVVIVLFVSLYTSKSENGKRFCLYPGVGKILFGCYFLFVIFQIVWTAAGLPE